MVSLYGLFWAFLQHGGYILRVNILREIEGHRERDKRARDREREMRKPDPFQG